MPVAALRLLSTIATGLAIDVYGAAEAIGVETSSVEELGTTAARNGRLCSALSWDAFASQISGSESDICISIFRKCYVKGTGWISGAVSNSRGE
ncbi:hypothetical protein V6N11_029985 [Hibiscus sabdariffa]|uniref:Secreted protein n=1 Tax=Hibiscus sabdariffa TaxID=183260 RepID=A0ABR2PJQ7_9ROSI